MKFTGDVPEIVEKGVVLLRQTGHDLPQESETKTGEHP
jgi:ATP phosphoribosyltransferase